MPVFHFRLEALLQHRIRQEDLAKERLREAQMEMDLQRRKLSYLQQKEQQAKRDLSEQKRSATRISDIQLSYTLLQQLGQQLMQNQAILQQSYLKVEERRHAVLEAMKQRKIIENLKERRQQEWEYQAESLEWSLFDELATQSYRRKEKSK